MAKRAKTDNRCASVPLNKELFGFLESYCERTGLAKTAVLRALIVEWKKNEEIKARQI